jgi:PTH1 family peptidyl-tRNA hydrolase
MKNLVVGLGNPGSKYKKTRHNIGFMVIDELKKSMLDKNVILLKPDTFMNNSGKAVKKILKNSPLTTQNLIVIHDDIDLPFGIIKASKNSSSAGHKGVQSIIDEIGTKDFIRIRIGIRPLLLHQDFKGQAEKFVLKKFTKQEKKQLKDIIKQAVEEILKQLKQEN